MSELLQVGSRVVRGPDWCWGDQDGGPGHVGTLVTIGHPQHAQCPPGTVKVIWDSGAAQNYRVGYGGQYDLRLLDLGTSGARQEGQCSQCETSPVYGLTWSCTSCPLTSLCSSCYMAGAHDLSHTFTRHQPGQPGVPVGPRLGERTSELLGLYPGAVVERGPDWRFDQQDGGPGSRGVLRAVHDWTGTGSSSARSVVSVVWSNKVDNMYCRAHKGQVHLQYVSPGRGGKVFQGHLPILGFKYESVAPRFLIGQHVMVNVDMETLKQMQVGHGGFNSNMLSVVGKRGKVHRMTEKGLVRVQFPGQPPAEHRWSFNPAALRLVQGHNVGDEVRVGTRARVERYQNPNALESVMGCSGVIKLIHSESSYVIDFGEGKVATLHPGCIEMTSEDRQSVAASCVKAAVQGDVAAVESFLTGTFSQCDSVNIPDNKTMLTCLHQAACRGHLRLVQLILQYRAALINERLEDKTVVQVAAHQGHSMMVDLLMQLGADPSLADKAGGK